MKILPFKKLPRYARNLIIYYTIAEPGVIGYVIFNAYLFKLGYSVIYVGGIISASSFLSAALLPLLGYLSDKRINAKYYLMVLETLVGISFLIYAVAYNGAWIFMGRILFSTAMLFSFSYSVYEREVYTEEIMEEIYVWHWILPSLGGMVSYLAGFIYFSIFPNVQAMRLYYLLFGTMFPFFVVYIYFYLPNLPIYRKREKLIIPRRFLKILITFILFNLTSYFLFGIALDNLIINYFGAGVAIIVFLSLGDSVLSFLSSILKAHISQEIWPRLPYLSIGGMGIIAILLFLLDYFKLATILLFILFYLLIAFLYPLWHMGFKPLLQSSIPREYRGTIFSSLSSLTRIINIPLAFITALIISIWSAFSPLLLAGILAFLTLVALHITVGK
ncbi:hypothetical protein AciM339_0693 [Aciduliprofundum sp. MAR08-339]|nr:hypothetical protein AciM339_0693 [Aciduliprofundum sp. MAR08-339]